MKKLVLHTEYGGFSLCEKARKRFAELTDDPFWETSPDYYVDYIPRHHWALVQVVEEMGSMAHGNADQEYAAQFLATRTKPGPLVVVNIPGHKYYITEYDGQESVMTPDSIQWISAADDFADPEKRKRVRPFGEEEQEEEEQQGPKRVRGEE